jgi:hypothetical protein
MVMSLILQIRKLRYNPSQRRQEKKKEKMGQTEIARCQMLYPTLSIITLNIWSKHPKDRS